MSASIFRVEEHAIPAQHIREYPGATSGSQEDELKLHIKQYTPLKPADPSRDAVTIIGAHANGFPKELYEPLWDEIYQRASMNGFAIRSIWMADVAHQGESGVLNEDLLGSDPSWYDHSRDLLHMVNYFRRQMPRPIIGIGHSFGGNQLVNLSLMHPRLFTGLILLDPVIEMGKTTNSDRSGETGPTYDIATASTYRRDIWPSRKTAAEAFAKSPFYQKWDKRVIDRWVEHGLRDLPTAIYPEIPNDGTGQTPVTLKTTKHQEVWTFIRPNYFGKDAQGHFVHNRRTHPDVDPSLESIAPFYRPEGAATFRKLPMLRPPVLYILGGLSSVSSPQARRDKVENTGNGVGGSGGVAEGKVKDIVLPGIGHLVPMEAVEDTAEECAQWLRVRMAEWRREEKEWEESRKKRNKLDDKMVNAMWKKHVGTMPARPKSDTKL